MPLPTRRKEPGARHRRPLNVAAYLAVLIGAAALGFSVTVLTMAHVVQQRARETLQSTMLARAAAASAGALPGHTFVATKPIAIGTPLAELSIPRVGITAVVLEGADDQTLRWGVGHIESTPLPGEHGNAAIAGHRDTFFRALRRVRVGDDVWVDTGTERVHYRVADLRVVGPSDVSVIAATPADTLTLVTCHPFGFFGSAPNRFIVRANRVDARRSPNPTAAGGHRP